ncbi:hypothetical protein AGOR_G00212130 [Albula goreensis]|uniref:Ig-like domain-containing protein n=1 Tax=Albula goreensis TaxID=1534307 RepID=A0A8T3CR91_9TELE|nr:hypothetical protein AGOR_G00212130 [Albula goreensis]
MRSPVTLSAWIVLALTGTSLVFPLMDAAPSSPTGPLSVTIIGPETVTAGEDVNFTCSADCSPSCTYTWMLEGQTADGKVATVTPSGAAKSLEMECTALNPESGKSLKMAKTVQVNNPLSVQPKPNTLQSFKKPFLLICVGADPTATIEWYKDGHLLTIDTQMTLPADNSTLKFNSLLPSHGGLYQCISEKGSSRIISVGYMLTSGPWSVKITGPKMAAAGERTDFTCSADCSPSCTHGEVFKNGGDDPSEQGGFPSGSYSQRQTVIRWTPDQPDTTQVFTCVVENTAARRSATYSKTVKVIKPSGPDLQPSPHPKDKSGSMALKPRTALCLAFSVGLLVHRAL